MGRQPKTGDLYSIDSLTEDFIFLMKSLFINVDCPYGSRHFSC